MENLVLNIEKILKDYGNKEQCLCDFEGEDKSIFIYSTNNSGMIRVYAGKNDNYGFISDLFVKDDMRRKGVGKELISIAEKMIGCLGLPFCQLRVKEGEWMEDWYKSLDFQELFKEEGYIWMIKNIK